jgi:hypothetical protein
MPRNAPGIDWPAIKARYLAGESPHSISKSLGNVPSKQAVYKKLKKERWGQIKPDRELVNHLVNSPRLTGELRDCHAFTQPQPG